MPTEKNIFKRILNLFKPGTPPSRTPAAETHLPYLPARFQEQMSHKYRFEAFLGKGGFAAVYRVTNLALQRTEALKVLLDSQHEDKEFADRFANEARVSASLDHPNIVRVYEFGETDHHFWFTMQYIDGPVLSEELKKRRILDEITAIQIILPLLDALQYSHSRGVIHRDIKPGNIIVDKYGRPFLMDFGIAKTMSSVLKTRTGRFLGTPVYVSPEQAAGHKIDGRTDIYAIGVTLYEMLSGALPFRADEAMQLLVKRLTNDPIPISQYMPEMDRELEEITMLALERDPDKRYLSAAAMKQRLTDFLGHDFQNEPIAIISMPPAESQTPSTITYAPLNQSTPMSPEESQPTEIMPPAKSKSKNHRNIGIIVAIIVMIIAVFIFTPPEKNNNSALSPNNHSTADETNQNKTIEKPTPSLPETPTNEDTPENTKEIIDSQQEKTEHNEELKTGSHSELSSEPGSEQIKPNTQPTQTQKTQSKKQQPKKIEHATPQPQPLILPRRPVHPPQIQNEITVTYPTPPNENCIGKSVSFSLLIGEDGHVKKSKLISSPIPECTEAVETIRQATLKFIYSPALDINGKPVETTIAIAITI